MNQDELVVFELSQDRIKGQKTFLVEINEESLEALKELRFRDFAYTAAVWGKAEIDSIADSLDWLLGDPLYEYVDELRSTYLDRFNEKNPPASTSLKAEVRKE